jgi:hypothetical protein
LSMGAASVLITNPEMGNVRLSVV